MLNNNNNNNNTNASYVEALTDVWNNDRFDAPSAELLGYAATVAAFIRDEFDVSDAQWLVAALRDTVEHAHATDLSADALACGLILHEQVQHDEDVLAIASVKELRHLGRAIAKGWMDEGSTIAGDEVLDADAFPDGLTLGEYGGVVALLLSDEGDEDAVDQVIGNRPTIVAAARAGIQPNELAAWIVSRR